MSEINFDHNEAEASRRSGRKQGGLAELIRELERLGVAQPPRMTIVCSWCQGVQDEGDGFSAVSHTICPACLAKYFPQCEAARANGGSEAGRATR